MSRNKNKKRKPDKRPPSPGNRYHFLLVFASAFLLYANTLGHGFVLDDDIYTKKNIFVQQGFSALKDIFGQGSLVGFNGVTDSQYRPISLLNFMIETHLFGMKAGVYHFFNVFYYAVSCVLVLLFLQKILKGRHALLPLTGALLFAFHPVHTEVVANIKSRDEILGFLFGMTSLIFLLEHAVKKKTLFLTASVFSYFLAVMSKENSLMFAFVIPISLYLFTEYPLKKILITSLPFAGTLLLYMGIRASVLTNIGIGEELIIMNNALEAAQTMGERYATNFVMLGKYIQLLLFPRTLSYDYSYDQVPIVGFGDPWAIISLLMYMGMGVLALWLLLKKNIHSFSILFYLLMLVLSSNLVIKIGATMAERFLFAPSLGFCLSAALILFSVFRVEQGTRFPAGPMLVAVTALVLYAVRTGTRNKDWENNFSLFESGIKTAPRSARVHNAMASVYRDSAEKTPDVMQRMRLYRLSVDEYKKGLEIYKPDPEAYYNMGVSYFGMGDTANAYLSYTQTLSLSKGYTLAMNNKGVICFNRKQYDSALYYFSGILQYNKNFIDAYANIGAVYQNTGQTDKAISYYKDLIQKGISNPSIYGNLSKIYKQIGDMKQSDHYARLAETR